ncbi:uncharacterized protein LOC134788970 [Penaeus indicus]|uniref:uncharacterized protein LOC134788970 n=1 Tax=Penaeus indicus TaxID=29960 RepID=UPI00300D5771
MHILDQLCLAPAADERRQKNMALEPCKLAKYEGRTSVARLGCSPDGECKQQSILHHQPPRLSAREIRPFTDIHHKTRGPSLVWLQVSSSVEKEIQIVAKVQRYITNI